MIGVLDKDEQAAARTAFSQVFTGTSLERSVFQPGIEARMLLFPTLFQVLEVDQYRAVFAAARALGEREAYIATYVYNRHGPDRFENWLAIDLDDADAYHREWPDEVSWEHAVFSPLGRWGVLTRDNEEAFLGGPPAFVDTVRERLFDEARERLFANEDEMVRDWLGYWEDNRRPDFDPVWIPDLLEHLYGPEQARAWLAHTSFAR